MNPVRVNAANNWTSSSSLTSDQPQTNGKRRYAEVSPASQQPHQPHAQMRHGASGPFSYSPQGTYHYSQVHQNYFQQPQPQPHPQQFFTGGSPHRALAQQPNSRYLNHIYPSSMDFPITRSPRAALQSAIDCLQSLEGHEQHLSTQQLSELCSKVLKLIKSKSHPAGEYQAQNDNQHFTATLLSSEQLSATQPQPLSSEQLSAVQPQPLSSDPYNSFQLDDGTVPDLSSDELAIL